MKAFRTWDPGQELLFPVSPRDWLPKDHLVHCVLDLMGQVDLSGIERCYQERDGRGERPYHPGMMASVLLYGYATGVASSRRLERATDEDVAVRVLTGGQHPDHSRISEFRREHLAELAKLFVQVLRVCQKAGLVTLGHVALDGTKVKANASKYKAMSYGRMLKSEQNLSAEVQALVERAERVDQEEDARCGRGVRGDELPEELRRREQRLSRLRAAKAEHARAERERGGDDPPGGAGA